MVVKHSRGSYAVEYKPLDEAIAELPQDSVIVTDSNLDGLYGHRFDRARIVVEAGEGSKSVETYSRVVSDLAKLGAKRSTTVVAFGGGVVGDLAGFVAATFMRGVPLIQIPTSLLAQVDSAVGGKVGIDLPEGKNLAGAFHQPQRVFIALNTLETLPARHFTNGMAEVCKYGLILDPAMADCLRKDRLQPTSGIGDLVESCIAHKARVVEEDEFETTGLRAILNFGHTIGHAIEAALNYEALLHGEAIAIGMYLEARLGEQLGETTPGTADEVAELLENQGLSTTIPDVLDASDLVSYMRRDKKADSAGLAFSLLTKVGECKLVRGVPEAEVVRALTNHDSSS